MAHRGSVTAIHAVVIGRVQGVGFRYSTQRRAAALGLVGWVRNRPEGSVEVWAQGNPHDVDRLVAFLRDGPPAAGVAAVHVDEPSPDPALDRFTVTF